MELATLDYLYLVREWQDLVGGRIQKIYMKDRMLILQVYQKQNYSWLFTDDESFLTTAKIKFPDNPKGYTMFLRKRIQGGRIRSIELLGYDRIVQVTVETKEGTHQLIVELFQKMNIMLCKDGKIISPWEVHGYTDRVIKGGAPYVPPKPRAAPWDADLQVLVDKEAARHIATDLGLGGKYSEELCARLHLDRKHKLHEKDLPHIYKELLVIRDTALQPMHNGTEALPFPFKTKEGSWEPTATFNEAIDAVEKQHLESVEIVAVQAVHKERQSKQEKIISAQKKQLEKLQKTTEESQRKGELIYENYAELHALLEQVRADWKKLPFKQLKEKYQDHPKIKSVEEDGTIEVEL
jgi:predicted ribosome quality control (RQC) complex YloA/Tae2 family protein